MQELIDYLRSLYVEGIRYELLTRLSGTLARLRIPLKTVLNLYSYLEDLDDEDRTYIIERAYERVQQNLPVKTLYSWKDKQEYKKLYDLIIKTFDVKSNLQFLHNEKDKLEEIKKEIVNMKMKMDFVEHYFNLDEFSSKITEEDKDVLEYLKSRKLEQFEIEKFNIRKGIKNYYGYVIFPVFDSQGNCVYFNARDYLGISPSKYKNPNKPKSKYIFNYYDALKQSKTVIICEGIINAITSMKYLNYKLPAVAVFGKTLSDIQIKKLQLFDELIFCFDGDVSLDYYKSKILPNFRKKKISIVKLPFGQDVNSLDKFVFLKYFFQRLNIQ